MAILDRTTGAALPEPLPHGPLLRAAYAPGPWLAGAAGPFVSATVGWAARQSWSAQQIPAFMLEQGVDPTTVGEPPDAYPTLDAFFAREAPEGARPIDPAPDAVISPCDGAVRVWPRLGIDDRIPVKGRTPTLGEVVGSGSFAARLDGAAAALVRLTPGDLHRVVQPIDGARQAPRRLGGGLHSVHPVALSAGAPALRNRRVVVPVGDAAVIAIGALNVGSVELLDHPGGERGDPIAVFHLGGSAVLLVIPDVRWDPDLLDATASGHEVRLCQGERLGRVGISQVLPFPADNSAGPDPRRPPAHRHDAASASTGSPHPRGEPVDEPAAIGPSPEATAEIVRLPRTLPDPVPVVRPPDTDDPPTPPGLLAALDPPNLISLASLTAAGGAILTALAGDLRLGFLLIGASAFLDSMDGGLARLMGGTGHARKVGRQLDSLVDACAFGLAPVVVLYQAGLQSPLELALLLALPLAVVMRLALHNARPTSGGFRGLPSSAIGVLLPGIGLLSRVDPPALRIGASSLVAALIVGMLAPVAVPRPSPRAHVLLWMLAGMTALLWFAPG